jgi:hypothetical protein
LHSNGRAHTHLVQVVNVTCVGAFALLLLLVVVVIVARLYDARGELLVIPGSLPRILRAD